ncbi:hypothetical protein [Methylobacterium trifolii]|uniref:hypothetical protein n=1 Tax=Methylobacterium trifolii TaxID=1003092 RepID=UPI001EE03353|nr:hypothetical protein [Methylobacterium trifolii]
MTAILTLCACTGASAGEFPKEGTASYTTHYVSMSATPMKMGDRTVAIYESSGITRNDTGEFPFNNMGTRCIGMREASGNDVVNRGSCIDSDPDGDQVFSTYEANSKTGHHIFVGGTGKYQGITGEADYTFQAMKVPEGARPMTLVPHKATWKLP